MGIIYILENKVTGKYYVGQTTKTFKCRFRQHQHSNSCVGKALCKYGSNNFNKILLEGVPNEELDYWEMHYINECKSISPNGYNLDSGGHKNKHIHKEHKEKLVAAGKETKFKKGQIPWNKDKKTGQVVWNKGKTGIYTKEVLEIMRMKKLGIPLLEEHKKKISKSLKGVVTWNKGLRGEGTGFYGHHHTEEAIRKNSEAHKGKPWSEARRKAYNNK
jgi:group I intron endonuclease